MVKKSGAPPQPAAMAKLKGYYRADRHRDEIADGGILFLSSVPEPPERLTEHGRKFWNDILGEAIHIKNYIAIQDIFMFEELCYNYQMMTNAKIDIEMFGISEVGEDGIRRKSIGYTIYKEASKDFAILCKEFGLSPSSRTGIKIVSNSEKEPESSDPQISL